ncbi:MAG: hypothetical protein J6L73_01410 [Muribaculaceae bacterium]|mgnify:CR=1 FL=1|nr:hypothetical protein [Muribaculaceae bacterium]
MKLLKTYNTETIAYIDKGFLADRGIETIVEGSAMSDVFPAPDAGTSQVGLYVVSDAQYGQARRLLDDRPE